MRTGRRTFRRERISAIEEVVGVGSRTVSDMDCDGHHGEHRRATEDEGARRCGHRAHRFGRAEPNEGDAEEQGAQRDRR